MIKSDRKYFKKCDRLNFSMDDTELEQRMTSFVIVIIFSPQECCTIFVDIFTQFRKLLEIADALNNK